MANTFAVLRSKRGYVLLALVVLAVVGAKFGSPIVGMWDGPL